MTDTDDQAPDDPGARRATNRTAGRRTTGKGTPPAAPASRVQYPARLDEEVYRGLQAASNALGTSLNSVLGQAAQQYLASPELDQKIKDARARQDDAIRKLSGG